MRIIVTTAEVAPIAKTGGLGDVCGSLPQALAALGHDVVVFMPFYRQAREYFERSGQPIEIAQPTTAITWNDWAAELTVFRSTLPGSQVPLYLLANDYFFNRDQIYSGRLDGHDDNLERYTFFSRAVIRTCEMLGLYPEILHAHDWHTALLPVFLHSGLRGSENFRGTRSVFTIHNLNYQGVGGLDRFHFLGLHDRYRRGDAL
ncbi:MAG TPA: glycogen/starch synthase, partial [Thermoanaerobaculia bacterium]|nr:glycogen/starch synthase [Thermoanaerobaculia bacterium]